METVFMRNSNCLKIAHFEMTKLIKNFTKLVKSLQLQKQPNFLNMRHIQTAVIMCLCKYA